MSPGHHQLGAQSREGHTDLHCHVEHRPHRLDPSSMCRGAMLCSLSGVFVDCKEIYELDYELMYRSDYRQNMRKYIDTKLPALCVRQPNRVPVPDSWCLCHDDDEEGGDNADNNGDQERFNVRCMVHGSCDECEEANAVCNCDWWYDQHYCTTCG